MEDTPIKRIPSEYDGDLKRIMKESEDEISDLRDYGTNMMGYEFEDAMERLKVNRRAKVEALTPDTPFRLLQFLDQEKEP